MSSQVIAVIKFKFIDTLNNNYRLIFFLLANVIFVIMPTWNLDK